VGSIALAGVEPETFQVQAWVVGTYTSHAGESRDAFVLRVAEALKAWTDETGTEACGPIAKEKDGTYYVQLTTEKAQTVCLRSTVMPAGMTYTGDNIHSHPWKDGRSQVKLTSHDLAVLEALGEVQLVDEMRRMGIRVVHAEPSTFSPDDYAGGPGYLVVRGQLLYQHGEGTAHQVATL
jgi:hypothetical protein